MTEISNHRANRQRPIPLGRLAILAALLGLGALPVGCGLFSPSAAMKGQAERASPDTLDVDLLSRLILDTTNRVRLAHGRESLAEDTGLDLAAAEQAATMALNLQASHENVAPGLHTVVDRVEAEGLLVETVAENVLQVPALKAEGGADLRYTYSELALHAVELWMASPGHRANVLDPAFTRFGCAARCGHGPRGGPVIVFVSEVFLLPVPEPPSKTQVGPTMGKGR